MTVPDVLRERVAEAIKAADVDMPYTWDECSKFEKDNYRRMAEAAIAALQLTEEWGVVTEDGFGEIPDEMTDEREEAEKLAAERCQSCDHCANALPKHVVSRFVGPWSTGNTETEEPQR